MGYLASVEETIAHAHRAAQLGLVHLIGRDRIDSLWTGGRPFGKLMTICHCCPCCCLFRVLPDLDPTNRAKVTRMPGVAVWVDADECLGCGQCAEQGCFVGALEIVDGSAPHQRRVPRLRALRGALPPGRNPPEDRGQLLLAVPDRANLKPGQHMIG